jgi:hypothetical protein
MLKTLAVIRTLFLIFIVGYTARAMPWFSSVPRTLDEQYSRIAGAADMVTRAAWMAVGWIAFETLLGWVMAARSGRKASAPTP